MSTNFCRYLGLLWGLKGFPIPEMVDARAALERSVCFLPFKYLVSVTYLTRLDHIRFYWHHYQGLQHSRILKEDPLVHWDNQSLLGKVWLHMTVTYCLESCFVRIVWSPVINWFTPAALSYIAFRIKWLFPIGGFLMWLRLVGFLFSIVRRFSEETLVVIATLCVEDILSIWIWITFKLICFSFSLWPPLVVGAC